MVGTGLGAQKGVRLENTCLRISPLINGERLASHEHTLEVGNHNVDENLSNEDRLGCARGLLFAVFGQVTLIAVATICWKLYSLLR
jgi:hypothetical protein